MDNNHKLLSDILKAITFITSNTRNLTYTTFCQKELIAEAVCRKIEIIGEAANKTTPQYKRRYAQIPWRQMINTRNKLIHDYDDIDLRYVWEIVTHDLPRLKQQIKQIIKPL